MDKRAAFRFPTDVEAECRSCDRAWGTRLVNISTTGCMIACPEEPLPDGALMRLRVKGLTAIDAQIVWQHRNYAGIKFRVPIHPAVMEHLAFRDTDRGYDTPAVALRPAAEPASHRESPRLHGQLVKRTWTSQEEAEPRRAAAG